MSSLTTFYVGFEPDYNVNDPYLVQPGPVRYISRNADPNPLAGRDTRILKLPNPLHITAPQNILIIGVLESRNEKAVLTNYVAESRFLYIPSAYPSMDDCLWVSTVDEAQKLCSQLSSLKPVPKVRFLYVPLDTLSESSYRQPVCEMKRAESWCQVM